MNILPRTISMAPRMVNTLLFVIVVAQSSILKKIETRRLFFPILNQVGSNIHRRPDAIGMRYRATIDPDERDIRATGSIYMSRLEQDQWEHQGS